METRGMIQGNTISKKIIFSHGAISLTQWEIQFFNRDIVALALHAQYLTKVLPSIQTISIRPFAHDSDGIVWEWIMEVDFVSDSMYSLPREVLEKDYELPL